MCKGGRFDAADGWVVADYDGGVGLDGECYLPPPAIQVLSALYLYCRVVRRITAPTALQPSSSSFAESHQPSYPILPVGR